MYKTFAIFALLFSAAVASHYRYGTMYYVPTGTRTIRISIDQAWRGTAFGVNVGQTFIPGGITFGDGGSANLVLTATSINLVDDIVAGSATITRTYANNAQYLIDFSTCCRIGNLVNNAGDSLRSYTTVDFANYPNNRSPVSSVLPIVVIGRGSPATFPITSIDPDGDALTYRLATTADFAAQTQPSGTSVNANTGLYSWFNQALGNGLYNTAVVISDGKCTIMVDFLMQLTNIVVSNDPPTWTGATPADQTAFTALVNNPISFDLTCNDQNAGNTVTIQTGVLPQGATLSAQSGSNPGTRSFTFSSSVATTSVVCFSCTDNLLASAGQVCFTLEVQGSCCDINSQAPTLNGVPSNLNLECGSTVPPAATVTATPICPDGASAVSVSASETQSGSVCNRVISRTWSFTDVCGRTATATQTITVRDTTAPTISSSGAPSQTIQCGSSTNPPATGSISASDVCDASVTISSSDTTTPSNCLAVASISRRWTATDDCNNVAVYTQSLTVVDSLQPTLTIPANIVRECGVDGYTPASTGFATATDACDSSVVPTFSDVSSASGCLALGSIARTWSVTDDCGNSVSGVQAITFQDTLAPTTSADDFCIFPPNGNYYCFDTTSPDFLHYSDACGTTSHVFNDDCQDSTGSSDGCVNRGNELCVRAKTDHHTDNSYTFSFTVSDACGNTKVQSVHVTVPNSQSSTTGNCRNPETCISTCPEERCEATMFDLITEAGDNIGRVFITNKLNYELDVEIKTNEGSIPDRGWWMLGVNIQVGSKRAVRDWSRSNAQSRWFEAIDVSHAFSQSSAPVCGQVLDVIVAVLATNDKRNNNGVSVRAYPVAQPSKRSFTLPPNINDFAIKYPLCCECTIRGQTQNDWGNICYAPQAPSKRTDDSPRIREIACYRDDFWNWSQGWCFPNGVVVGCTSGFTATWNTPVAIATGLADQTSARVLTQNWVNPPQGSVGYLAGETAALTLNTRLDECDSDFGTSCNNLGDLYVCRHPTSTDRVDCAPFYGNTVSSILSTANSVLGGCASGDVNALFKCVRYINREFVDGKRLWEAPDFSPRPCVAN